jgi:signal transduction histidine kinase
VTATDANHYYKTQAGKIFPVASVTAPLRNGDEIIGVVKVFRDVTAEKEQNIIIEREVQERTQEISEKNVALQKARDEISQGWFELQEEKARLTASITSLSLGFILTDTTEHIVVINPAASRTLELHQEATEFNQIESVLKNSIDLHMLHLKCESERRTIEVTDIVFGNKYLRIFLAPILSTAKGLEELIGTVILLEDTTEAKVMERSKDEFFSIASHELRTPLTSIRGNTSMILDYYKDQLQDRDLVEMLKDINASSIRLISIVNDFLNVSRLEQKKMEFKKESFDVIFLINQVFQELQSMKNQNVEVRVENGDGKAPRVLADPDKTKEVLINLIGNALKFTEHGEVVVSIFAENSSFKIFVRDTGRGITPQYQSLLFRKFQQAGESLFTRDTTKGTGLGLYISKLLVEGMGGQIWLERSEAGKGTVFGFTLPSGN